MRFSLALRGYRMSEVDALLERLATQLDEQATGPAGAPAEDPAARPTRGDGDPT